jgi:hypothetical protein
MSAALKKKKTLQVRWVNKDEFSAMMESRARRVLGISERPLFTRW